MARMKEIAFVNPGGQPGGGWQNPHGVFESRADVPSTNPGASMTAVANSQATAKTKDAAKARGLRLTIGGKARTEEQLKSAIKRSKAMKGKRPAFLGGGPAKGKAKAKAKGAAKKPSSDATSKKRAANARVIARAKKAGLTGKGLTVAELRTKLAGQRKAGSGARRAARSGGAKRNLPAVANSSGGALANPATKSVVAVAAGVGVGAALPSAYRRIPGVKKLYGMGKMLVKGAGGRPLVMTPDAPESIREMTVAEAEQYKADPKSLDAAGLSTVTLATDASLGTYAETAVGAALIVVPRALDAGDVTKSATTGAGIGHLIRALGDVAIGQFERAKLKKKIATRDEASTQISGAFGDRNAGNRSGQVETFEDFSRNIQERTGAARWGQADDAAAARKARDERLALESRTGVPPLNEPAKPRLGVAGKPQRPEFMEPPSRTGAALSTSERLLDPSYTIRG